MHPRQFRFKRNLLAGIPALVAALLMCAGAVMALTPPTVLNVAETVSSNTGTARGFIAQWTDNSSDENLFEMRIRFGDTGSYYPVQYALSGNDYVAWYPDDSVLASMPNGTKFYFQVLACKATLSVNQTTGAVSIVSIDQRSGASNVKSLTYYSTSGESVLNPPTNLILSIPDDGHLRVQFNDNSKREDGYQFFIRTSGGSYSSTPDAQTLPFGIVDYTLPNYAFLFNSTSNRSGLEPGQTYVMKMRAFQGFTQAPLTSAFSNEVTFTVPALVAPTNLTFTPIDESKYTLNWTDNSKGEHYYFEEWKAVGGSTFTFEAGTAANTTSYEVTDTIPGRELVWHIQAAYNPATNLTNDIPSFIRSAASNEVTAKTLFKAPTNLQITGSSINATTGARTYNLSWVDNSSKESGYAVLAKQGNETSFSAVGSTTDANATSTSVTIYGPGIGAEFVVAGVFIASGSVQSVTDYSNSATVDGFTSQLAPPITSGVAFSYQLATTAFTSRTSWDVQGLPTGLAFNSTTGVVSGTTTQFGVFACPMTAVFANGTTASATLTLRVALTPAGPTKPVEITSRKMAPTVVSSVPLSTLFADADTESAVRVNTTYGNIDIILNNTLTPLTVANFMTYVNAHEYDGSVFHRAPSGFVVQGGAFVPTATGVDTFNSVPTHTSPLNEPGISSLAATVALAKLGGDPNSGTHDFFFNLGNNSANLDFQNGGFTVFGRVAGGASGASMAIVNTIAGKPKGSYSIKRDGATTAEGPYADWPVDTTDSTAPSAMDNTKMVVMNSVTSIPTLNYAITNAPDSATATASIDNGNLVITGVAEGTTSLTISATDLDGNPPATQTMTITVDATYVSPNIVEHPVSLVRDKNQSAVFTVTADGTDPHYQWRKNGKNIAGATGASYTIPSVIFDDEGSYSVVVSNDANVVESNAATLTVHSPPEMTSPLVAQNVTKTVGQSVTFTVAAKGSPTMTYKWFHGASEISAQTAASLTIATIAQNDEGSYTAEVTNTYGSVTSVAFNLTVNPLDSDGDGLSDLEELALVPPTDIHNPDSDGDGYSDGVEVALGSKPKDNKSTPATNYFVAAKDGLQTMNNLALTRIASSGSGTLQDRLSSGSPSVAIAAHWLGTYEMTNNEYASVLDRALNQYGLVDVIDVLGRKAVRYPKTTGQIICYVANVQGTPESCDISFESRTNTFYVAKALARSPVRAVNWYGAYLATLVLNKFQGYNTINLTSTFGFDNGQRGYHLPNYVAWEWVARGAANPGLTYTTGASASPTLACFNNTSTTAKPKTVGSYAKNKLGIYDIGGNVAEWMAETSGSDGFVRGGGYSDPSTALKNTEHEVMAKTIISPKVGIRLAMNEDATPRIITPPQQLFVKTGDTINLSVTAGGAPPLTYQWFKNGTAMAGKTSPNLSITSCKIADAGAYTVKVTSNGTTSVTTVAGGTNNGHVAVIDIPVQTPTLYVVPNGKLNLPVKIGTAKGQTYTYSWVQNGATPVTNNAVINGSASAMLQILSAQSGHTGSYTCKIQPDGLSAPLFKTVPFNVIVYDTPIVNPPSTLPWSVVGGAYSYQVPYVADNTRVPTKWIITGLPPGMTYNPLTGVIYGRPKPSTKSVWTIKIKASNPWQTSSEITATLNVALYPVEAQGNFTGTVARHSTTTGTGTNSVGVNSDLGGRIDFNVTSSGYYTAKLKLGSEKDISFTGYLEPFIVSSSGAYSSPAGNPYTLSAQSEVTLTRVGRLPLKLKLNVDTTALNPTNVFSGSIGELAPGATIPSTSAAIAGWRNKFGVVITTTGRNGSHNFAVNPPAGLSDPALNPQGSSYGSISVADGGATSVVGKMADGTGYSSSGYMSPTGQVLIYSSLYSKTGSVLGKVAIANDTNHTITISDSLTWMKKNQGTASTSRSYKLGFTNLLSLEMLGGGKYTPPAGTILLGLDAATGTPATNAKLSFSTGALTSSFQQLFGLSALNAVMMPKGLTLNPNTVAFSFVKATGVISGTFIVEDDDPTSTTTPKAKIKRNGSYYGAVVPNPSLSGKGIGYGFFNLPKLPDSLHVASKTDILSDKVVLDKK